ncbi:MAG: hypothetical protein GSR85_04520 [Desulfurococcales archaeon]|nr:hypothetical protein [Desulfurococcales archaeon]
MSRTCNPDKDFLRHIVNKVIADNSNKIPLNIVDDIKKSISIGESKYRFSIFGGEPSRLVEYFESDEWKELVEFSKNLHVTWLLEDILSSLAETYKDSCREVAEKALEVIEKQLKTETKIEETINPESIYRTLKYSGFKAEINSEGTITLEEPFIKVKLEVKDNKINYTICKTGKASTLDAVMAKIDKIREL